MVTTTAVGRFTLMNHPASLLLSDGSTRGGAAHHAPTSTEKKSHSGTALATVHLATGKRVALAPNEH